MTDYSNRAPNPFVRKLVVREPDSRNCMVTTQTRLVFINQTAERSGC